MNIYLHVFQSHKFHSIQYIAVFHHCNHGCYTVCQQISRLCTDYLEYCVIQRLSNACIFHRFNLSLYPVGYKVELSCIYRFFRDLRRLLYDGRNGPVSTARQYKGDALVRKQLLSFTLLTVFNDRSSSHCVPVFYKCIPIVYYCSYCRYYYLYTFV